MPRGYIDPHTKRRAAARRYMDRAEMQLSDYQTRPETPAYLALATLNAWAAAGLDPAVARTYLDPLIRACQDAGARLLPIGQASP